MIIFESEKVDHAIWLTSGPLRTCILEMEHPEYWNVWKLGHLYFISKI